MRRISEDEIQTILAALDYVENERVTTQRQHIAEAFCSPWKLKWPDVNLDRAFVTHHETRNGEFD